MRENNEKNAKCGGFFSDARGNAKLMINFFGLTLRLKSIWASITSLIIWKNFYPIKVESITNLPVAQQ